MRKTTVVKKENIKREWFIVDLSDLVLGRAANEIARILTGKGKVLSAPNSDTGDYVVAINASKIVVTGNKEDNKVYYRHSGFPGGYKETLYKRQLEKDASFIIRKAVKGMLPKNKLQDPRLARLYIYNDEKHDKVAQLPKEIKLKK